MLNIIVAVAGNRVIGKSGKLPWYLADDMRWFRETTFGRTVVMGSTTYLSIPPRFRPLPGRENVVLTRNPCLEILDNPNITVTSKFSEILNRARKEIIFIAGGAKVYSLALPYADHLFLTKVHAEVDGDTFFPEWSLDEWKLDWSSTLNTRDERNSHDFTWEIYRRVTRPA